MADISYSWAESKYFENNSIETEAVQIGSVQEKAVSKIKTVSLKILIAVFIIGLIAELIFYFLILPSKSIALVNISGLNELSSVEIKNIANISGDVKWLSINSSVISKKLIACPLIASVTVEKKFPDKIFINIKERKAVAVVFANIQGRTKAMEIDKYGVVFRIGSFNVSKKLPVITGLTFDNPRAGMRVSPQLADLFIRLDVLQKNNSRLLNEISEIKIQPKKYGTFDLVIYPIKSRLSIVTNNILTEESLSYLALIVDVAKDIGMDKKIAQIDIRGSNAVYKKRGALNE